MHEKQKIEPPLTPDETTRSSQKWLAWLVGDGGGSGWRKARVGGGGQTAAAETAGESRGKTFKSPLRLFKEALAAAGERERAGVRLGAAGDARN